MRSQLMDPFVLSIYGGMSQFEDIQDYDAPTVETARFRLRAYSRPDFFAWYLFVKRGGDINIAPRGIARQLRNRQLLGEGSGKDRYWVIESLESGYGIGNFYLEWSAKFQALEGYLFLAEEYRGKGYGIEIAQGIKTILVNHLKPDKVIFAIKVDNKRSLSLIRRIVKNVSPTVLETCEGDFFIWRVSPQDVADSRS